MQVIVKARHTKVPESLKQMAIQKVERVRRFFDRIIKLEIEFSEEHNPRQSRKKHIVEVTLSTKAHLLRAKASGADPAAAVDAVVDKLETQVKRLKDKMKGKTRPARAETIRVPSTTGSPNGKRRAKAAAAESGARKVRVRQAGRFSVKPLTPLDAALALEQGGDQFMAFLNIDTGLISVVYRMDDGSFGLLEPAEA
jgi:putative sigma-54 modulation protein